MSWIKDVKEELSALEISKKILRKFAFTVGGIFLLIGFYFYFTSRTTIGLILLSVGTLLLVFGILLPNILNNIYKIWMGLAFALGWIMSRILLTILFYLVLTPVGFIAKVVGKKFLDIKFRDNKESYWVKRDDSKVDYSKMY